MFRKLVDWFLMVIRESEVSNESVVVVEEMVMG